MRPHIKDTFLNDAPNQNRPHNPLFLKGEANPELEPWNQATSRSRDGSHAGKGPKFYRRSDLSIREDVCEALTKNPNLDATNIEVKVEKSIVTLSGAVPNRQMKRLAETCLDHIHGVQDVLNHLQASVI